MSKNDKLLDQHIEAHMDDIPEEMWYNKQGQTILDEDISVEESVPSFVKLECLSSW